MPLNLPVTQSGYQRAENEWYPATIDSIEETEHAQYGAGLKWVILLDDEADSDYPDTWAFSSQTISPGSKVYDWITGIYGRAPGVGVSVDLEKLFGKRVQVSFAAHSSDPNKQVVSRFRGLDETPPETHTDTTGTTPAATNAVNLASATVMGWSSSRGNP